MNEDAPKSANQEPPLEVRFSSIYEGSSLSLISYDELPITAAEHFESQSEKFILPEKYVPKNFSTIGRLSHTDGSVTYFAEQTKTYSEKGESELLTYFMDYIDGEPAGYSELRYNNTSELGSFTEPFVGMTRTYGPDDKKYGLNNFQKRGLGERRLIEMDAYARAVYGKSLDSDTVLVHDNIDYQGNLTSSIARIWERFVEEGKAEKYVRSVLKDGSEIFAYRMK